MNVYVDSPNAPKHSGPAPVPAPIPGVNSGAEPPLVYLELTTTDTQLQRRYRIDRSDGGHAKRLPMETDWPALSERLQRWKTDGVSILQAPAFGDDLYQALFGPPDNGAAGQIAAEAW